MASDPQIPLDALVRIVRERARQEIREGYTLEHDDEHDQGQMAVLSAFYAISSLRPISLSVNIQNLALAINALADELEKVYGWEVKPKDPIRDLERAGALILAELERRLRLDVQPPA